MSIYEDLIYIPYNQILEEVVSNVDGVIVLVTDQNVYMDVHMDSPIYQYIRKENIAIVDGKLGKYSRIKIHSEYVADVIVECARKEELSDLLKVFEKGIDAISIKQLRRIAILTSLLNKEKT